MHYVTANGWPFNAGNAVLLFIFHGFRPQHALHIKVNSEVAMADQCCHEFHQTSVTFYFMKKDSKRCCDTTMPESIHTKDESKCSSAFAFIFGVN